MSYTIEYTRRFYRLRRIRRQIEAIERALAQENDCIEVLQFVAAAQVVMERMLREVFERDSGMDLVDPPAHLNDEAAYAAEELIYGAGLSTNDGAEA